MLGAEDVAVQLRDPLLAADRHVEIPNGGYQVLGHARPEEVRVTLNQISRRGIAKLLRDADLGELMKQGIGLAQVVEIAKLADQVAARTRPASASISA